MEFNTDTRTDFNSVNTVAQGSEYALSGNRVNDTNPPDLHILFDGASEFMGSLAAHAGLLIVATYIAGPEQNFNRVLEYSAGAVILLGGLIMVAGNSATPIGPVAGGAFIMCSGGIALWGLKS